MKRLFLSLITAMAIVAPATAHASMNSKIDYSEPRIAAVFVGSPSGYQTVANGSAYVYSPRIVFSAGHIGQMTSSDIFYVGDPDKKLSQKMKVARVIKVYIPITFDKKALKDDFSIFVLDRPISTLGKANLVSADLLHQAVESQTAIKISGYGVYKDACKILGQKPRCNVDAVGTSTEPRSIFMTPVSYATLASTMDGLPHLHEVSDHLFMKSDFYTGPCPGDSGGSSTMIIGGVNYYVGTTPSGFWGGYSCGQSSEVNDSLGYTAPVYKFAALIKEAEAYVAAHKVSTKLK